MGLQQDVSDATNNDIIMWCDKQLDGETVYYSRIPYGNIVFIPSTNTLKLWSTSTNEVASVVHDYLSEITDNIQRHTDIAEQTKNK